MAAHVMTHMTDIEIGTLLHGISPLIPLQGRETSIGTLLTATHLTTPPPRDERDRYDYPRGPGRGPVERRDGEKVTDMEIVVVNRQQK